MTRKDFSARPDGPRATPWSVAKGGSSSSPAANDDGARGFVPPCIRVAVVYRIGTPLHLSTSSERTMTVTSPMQSAQTLSSHNRAILTQMQTMVRQIQMMTTELEYLPKLRMWNTVQNLLAEVRGMLVSDMTPRLH